MAKDAVQGYIEASLQALAFWVGYQNEVYRHHTLPEGAIVAELTRLISGKVGTGLRVECEILYRELISSGNWDKKALADIAITEILAKTTNTLALVEVKRLKPSGRVIDDDLIKIGLFKKISPGTRAYLVIVGQAEFPDRWVDANGKAIKGISKIELHDNQDSEIRYKVLRVLKAASSFEKKNSASYCCLIEVI